MQVAVIGTGLVGRSWAMIFARAGWQVRLWDAVPGVAEGALDLCRTGLEDLHRRGLCDAPGEAAARIAVAPGMAEALTGADFVQESGPERVEVKRELFAGLDRLAAPGIPLASSTSALRCSAWSEHLPGRARCLVGHPVNPPHLVPLVEISGAPWTAPEVVATAREVYESIGQAPIEVRREIDGFVLNRLQAALLGEAFRLVKEGVVSPADLDRTITHGLGMRWAFMGPFATIELNAPGGIADYVGRFRGFLELIPNDPAPAAVFDEAGIAAVTSQWSRAADPAAKMRWRDDRLAALRVHLDSEEEEVG